MGSARRAALEGHLTAAVLRVRPRTGWCPLTGTAAAPFSSTDLCVPCGRSLAGRPARGLRPSSAYAILVKMDLMPGADGVVRQLLPVALDACSPRQAERLRALPELRDAGSVSMACGTMRRVRAFLSGSPGLASAVRSCEEAACAALAGDAVRFGRYVREAAGAVRSCGASPAPS